MFNFNFRIKCTCPASEETLSVTLEAAHETEARALFAQEYPKCVLDKLVDPFTRRWITAQTLEILPKYEPGMLTLRGLHYQLVARGMTNTHQHYKRVVGALIQARWDGVVPFDTFTDEDRRMENETANEQTTVADSVEDAKRYINYWLNNYTKNRWENQPNYVEVMIEKKALLGVFKQTCKNNEVALGACKGYPSLTFLDAAHTRFRDAYNNGFSPVLIYFGDYDPSGEDIPRSIQENLARMGVHVRVERVLLQKHHVIEMDLPFAPAKVTDSRTANWDGLGQVELDAVEPSVIIEYLEQAIDAEFNDEEHDTLVRLEEIERKAYRVQLAEYAKSL